MSHQQYLKPGPRSADSSKANMSSIGYVTGEHDFKDPLPVLARANHFTMADLEQNRDGKISDAQWFRLLLRPLQAVRYTGGALLGWLLFCLVVRTVVPRIVLWFMAMRGIGVFLVGGVTLACVGAFLLSVLKSAGTLALLIADLSSGKAAFIEGRVSPSREDEEGLGLARFYGEKNTNYWYVIKNEYFEVDQAAHEALPAGMRLRLYYAPKSKLLLSIEPKSMSDAENSRAAFPQ
jgi:hypothetical protein